MDATRAPANGAADGGHRRGGTGQGARAMNNGRSRGQDTRASAYEE